MGKVKKIYTIHVKCIEGDINSNDFMKTRTTNRRTWGWYSTKKDALKSLRWKGHFEMGEYNYGVVEEITEGINWKPRKEWWVSYNTKTRRISSISKPKCFHNVVCFAMG